MDKKLEKKLNAWLENDLITEDVLHLIQNFEDKDPSKNERGNISKTIILIGGLFVFIGLTAIIDEVFPDWAQLLSLIIFTSILFYSAFYIEKKYEGNTFLFESNEKLTNFIFLIGTGAFGSTSFFIFEFFDIDEDISRAITSLITFILSVYLFNKTKYLYQQFTLLVSTEFFLITLLEFIPFDFLDEELVFATAQFIVGLYFLRFTFNFFEPKWLGYLFSCFSLVAGVGFIDSYLGGDEFVGISLQIVLAISLIWLSVKLSSETILFVGSLSLLINLPRLINEIFPNLGFLFLLISGSLLIFVGLYLNRLRENIKKV